MNDELKNAVHILEECSAKIKKTTCRLSDEWKTDSGEIIEMKAGKISSDLQNIADELMKIAALEDDEK